MRKLLFGLMFGFQLVAMADEQATREPQNHSVKAKVEQMTVTPELDQNDVREQLRMQRLEFFSLPSIREY